VNVPLVVGCTVAGALVGVWLPVDVTPTEDGTRVASGPRPEPRVLLTHWWGRLTVAATAALWAGFAIQRGAVWELPADLVLAAGLAALAVIDQRVQLLPRRIVWPLLGAALALFGLAAAVTGDGDALLRAVACAAGAYAVFAVLHLVNPGLAAGDVTLAAVLGLALGWGAVEAVIVGLAAGMILAAAFALVALALRQVHRDTALSYGPFLIAGALLVLLAAPDGRLFG
jgi:leader peptidase (prepilin peptidase)/N-methyltransferase